VLRPLGPQELVVRVLNTATLGEATLVEFVGVRRLTLPFLSPKDVEWLAFCGQQQGMYVLVATIHTWGCVKQTMSKGGRWLINGLVSPAA
jgi:hypothetical protein